MEWLKRSPETTLAGLGALAGLLVMLLGLAFGKDEAWKAGMGMVGAAASIGLTLARSERQHQADKPELEAEMVKVAQQESSVTVLGQRR
jgi:hypothetical protein